MTTVLAPLTAAGIGILNYGDLKDATLRWLNKSEGSSASDEVAIFVRLAETMIRRDIRVRVQEQLETGVTTDNTITVPDLFLEARRLIVGSRRKDYITPEQFQDLDQITSNADKFTVIGEDIYILSGSDGDSYSLLYWQAFEAFVNDPDTNWLLLNAPEVYLWASCAMGAEFQKDFEANDRFLMKYRQAVAMLNASEKNMRTQGSPLYVRASGSKP